VLIPSAANIALDKLSSFEPDKFAKLKVVDAVLITPSATICVAAKAVVVKISSFKLGSTELRKVLLAVEIPAFIDISAEANFALERFSFSNAGKFV
jgi:hypothetical protein